MMRLVEGSMDLEGVEGCKLDPNSRVLGDKEGLGKGGISRDLRTGIGG